MTQNNNQWILATVICAVSLFSLLITDMIIVSKERYEVESTIDCRETKIVHEGERVCVIGDTAYTMKTNCEGYLWTVNCSVEAIEQPQFSVGHPQIYIDYEVEQNEL